MGTENGHVVHGDAFGQAGQPALRCSGCFRTGLAAWIVYSLRGLAPAGRQTQAVEVSFGGGMNSPIALTIMEQRYFAGEKPFFRQGIPGGRIPV